MPDGQQQPATTSQEPSSTLKVPDLSWGLNFRQYSPAHLTTVTCCVAVIATVVWIGRRHRQRNKLARGVVDAPGEMLGALLIAYWFIMQLWWIFPYRPMRDSWLPLQLCDLAGLVGGLALVFGYRWLNTVLYFWAFALSTNAYFTPIIREGPATARFWLFWESHTAIISAAVYIVAVRGYRPRWRDVLFGMASTLIYAAVVIPLDIRFGWNYGFVGNSRPNAPTLIDQLGAWPWRLIPLTGIVFAAMTLVWLPWALADRFGARKSDTLETPKDEAK